MVYLTEKQQMFLKYLEQEITDFGKAPSLRKAAVDLGVSHVAVAQMIKNLEEKKVIKRGGKYSREVYFLQNNNSGSGGTTRWKEIPVIGTIAAGLPLYAQQEWDGSVVVDKHMFGGSNLFALKIKGDSMKNAAILDQDYVICEPRQFANNGEIVVALIHNEEATCKTFYHRKKYIELRPENPDFKPVKYGFGEVLIQGKVIGLIRSSLTIPENSAGQKQKK